jgi:hypothetical protein
MALETFINGDKQEKGKKRGRSLRFDLDLVPPTEEFTNEFSYTDLVEGGERKGEGPTKLGETLETGTDNQLAALAQRLEQKYGVRKLTRVARSVISAIWWACAKNNLRTKCDVIYTKITQAPSVKKRKKQRVFESVSFSRSKIRHSSAFHVCMYRT